MKRLALLLLLASPALAQIQVQSATYGTSLARINVTASVAATCNGQTTCPYLVNPAVIGDPAPGLAKTLAVDYRCGALSVPVFTGPPTVGARTVRISCAAPATPTPTRTPTPVATPTAAPGATPTPTPSVAPTPLPVLTPCAVPALMRLALMPTSAMTPRVSDGLLVWPDGSLVEIQLRLVADGPFTTFHLRAVQP